jgi:NAD(P)-dependent dehydrogenase (short-subunit alcohol dehydrogenase family)
MAEHPETQRTAVVTGASSGIGAAVAIELARDGYRIALVGRDKERLSDTERGIQRTGGEAYAICTDLAEEGAARRVIAESVEWLGDLDCLVCAAGVLDVGPFEEVTAEVLDRQWKVNARAPFFLAQAALPHLEERRGSIVFFVSPAGEIGQAFACAYGMSKAAVAQLTRALGTELAARGVRVNSVSPGWIPTPMNEELRQSPNTVALAMATTPLGRFGTPQEVASAVRFLTSPAASYITGVVLPVGGGYPALPTSLLTEESIA